MICPFPVKSRVKLHGLKPVTSSSSRNHKRAFIPRAVLQGRAVALKPGDFCGGLKNKNRVVILDFDNPAILKIPLIAQCPEITGVIGAL
jgi:hypothetical protein